MTDPFLGTNVRYHCPVVGNINHFSYKCHSFRRKIWLYDKGNFDEYRRLLSLADLNSKITDGDIDDEVEAITKSILDSVSLCIPNKMVTIRSSDKPWLHNGLRKLIRKRKRLYKKAKLSNTQFDWYA